MIDPTDDTADRRDEPSRASSAGSDSEHDAVRKSIRDICQRFGPEYWRKTDDERAYPAEFMQVVGEAGFFGTLIAEKYGGLGLGAATASIVVEEINRAGGDAATINAQMAICGTLERVGTEEQKQRYLPGVASGAVRFLTVAATEPDSGADMSHLTSTARRDGGDWILDAKKVLISLAEQTDVMILLVQTEEGPTTFLLDMAEHRSRIELHPIELVANRHTTTLFIDGLRVPDSTRLGKAGGGLRGLMGGFSVRRILAAAESIGNARFFLDRSLEHAKTRRTFDRFIGQNQGVQYPIAQAYARTEAADLMRWDAVRTVDANQDAGARSALAKVLASEAAWEAARTALTTFGGWGLAGEYHLERKLRDATVFVFNNMLLTYVAERVLGLPKAF
ncbi:MAG: acyl-CoA dehydrogenase family protein [Polyangiaceae bacterium]